ncbi:glycosyl transferase [Paracoccus sediminis]|uniref:Peptide O-xylosyltransferase n=1 Tax=Paracoccus sediminis TaxID=1214787 RepID=A0A238VF75_9RHOB|nr:beta-1,6-N-acetylglucosaminyltransferase [Paracoccus sediminis]TBN51945.1 glycosyl transferase [Paracoccus sediminis]SNR32323.1 Core-2/I-Branching enzyme [Paracoccus sediminis]
MTPAVRLGVVLLCHGDLDMAARLARIWTDGGAQVAIHVDAKVGAARLAGFQRALGNCDRIVFSTRHRCSWGRFSLVRATQDAAILLLDRFPDTTHVYLASGACLPLRPISDLIAYLAADPGRDHIESVSTHDVGWTVGGLNEERFTLFFPFDWKRRRWLFDRFVDWQRRRGIRRRMPAGLSPHLGSQWWCLTARTLRAILDDPRRDEFDRFFRFAWIPDESYFQTLVRRHSTRIESWSLTMAKFDHTGRPYSLYDDHAGILAESRCFVARKIWPGASGLLSQFPLPDQGHPQVDPPQPARISRIINQTVRRRVLGRPGLYMQSRFPRKDAENGKTSAPYAVLQGLTDIFPGFEGWLGRHLTGQVHGHLLDPALVEFAGRPQTGPGAISIDPQVRDHDPQGFLTSLIRITDRMQAFQFSPRDNQALNWFMATDPNAHMLVVTGAWKLPILHSGMPFDDMRRIFAQLQRIELAQLDVLNSVWVRARLSQHDLGEFLLNPRAILQDFLLQIDPHSAPIAALPAMRDLTGLDGMLRRLRNSGLRPRLTGEDLPPIELLIPERAAAE